MRKYDGRNKRNIGIIIGISIFIVIMFSLCIRYIVSREKNEFTVDSGALVFDKDKNIIKLSNSGIIKTKWNNEYYLIYDDYQSELGNTALSYNESTGEIRLYGRYYEIGSGDEITVTEDETLIKSSALTKFYKLADRKYLVIDKDIKTEDGLLSTSDFLLIDLDKVGNATFTNHKVSLKVFTPSTIVTSNYSFDIANEILTYGSDKIDLKKIIGSSNTFTKEDLIPEENSGSGNEIDDGNNGITVDTDNQEGNGEDNNATGGNDRNNLVIEEAKKEAKRTSVIAVTSTSNKIVADYVIYDPYNEYSQVYMEVKNSSSNITNTYYLNKGTTSYELTQNIFPNTTYNISFKYSYLDENNNLVVEEFDNVNVTTKKPVVSLKVTRVKRGEVSYSVSDDNSCNLTSGTLITYVNREEVSREDIALGGNKSGSLILPYIREGDIVELSVISGVTASNKFSY